ncbi:TonB-dependent receptor [Poseidonibacter lekithochrous]|uniref:TonB-dependent receptor plug domain-containing protein n=1 Tax=Poseidonibacter TaxID=2321187 RepID=UPI001C0A57FC|nr:MULTISPECIES: TonB-dependent receptor [Poseidonibacter]MBU3014741.1 TonB-dependent receptor [Poseidonibacter lekithochrous]MDO6828039.1 TonB-dependent receptor [Poseidonibacter sp. 1_MG-2023]
MKVKKLSISLSILLLFSNTYATNTVNLDKIKVTTVSLGEEKNIEDVQASIEVFDTKYIEQSNSKNVPQLLNNAIGLTVNDAGSTSSVSMRGFSSSHTLILVDGLRRTGKYGSFDLTSVQLEDIDRVEIVRGPMSALYGADGIAGVINVITKKNPRKDYLKLTLLGGAAQNGQRETYITKLNGAEIQENISHTYSIELREKNDYRLDKSSIATDLKNESRQFLSYANGIKLSDNDTLNTRLEYSRQEDKGKNYINADLYEKENRYQLSTQYNHIDENFVFDSNLAYGYSDTDVNRGSGSETTEYKQLEFNNYFRHYTSDEMTNILGAGYKNDDIKVSMYTKEASRDNFNLLFQNEYYLTDSLITNFGLRYDDFSDFGDTINPKVSLMYKISNFNFRTSYGEAFKAPSFTNMYSHFTRSAGPVIYDISGNENLKPEESKTYEFSINYNKDNFDFEIIHHRSKLDNLVNSYTVSYDPTTRTSYTSYENIDKSSINGTEVSTKYNFNNGFAINLAWEYLDTKDKTTNERLTGSAKTTVKMNLSYEINDLSMYLNLKKYNNYYGTNESRVNVNSDYTVADLKVNYKFSKHLEWFVGVDNIQDKQMPYNMTSRGTPNDPGERFYYTGINVLF